MSVEALRFRHGHLSAAVVDPKIKLLPFEDISPEDFERLIARLANPSNSTSVRTHLYGSRGSTQGGIDVILNDPLAQRFECFECKHRSKIVKGDITVWVRKFLEGPHSDEATRFVVSTSFNVAGSTGLLDEWRRCAALLTDRKIDSDLWDESAINRLLRYRRDIVAEFFGDMVADRFCVQAIAPLPEPAEQKFRVQYVNQDGCSLTLENISVACQILLPSDESLNLSASLSFTRRDLSGTSVSVAGQELVRWMQWRAHSDQSLPRPYALRVVDDQDKLIFTSSAARLSLTIEEVTHLDWVLLQAWSHFFNAASMQLTRLKAFRFRRLGGTAGPFVLVSASRSLWQAMLDFAKVHDVAKGDSRWHIFDAAPGCLKVYTPKSTDCLDSGYHAILYAYEEGGIWLPWKQSVLLGWQDPEAICGGKELSARSAWDAEYTHDWLIEEFIPEVLRWKSSPNQVLSAPFSLWPRAFKRASRQASTHDISEFATSSAVGLNLQSVPTEFGELKACVEELQSHFISTQSSVDLEPAAGRAIYRAIDRALSFANLHHEGYLRTQLGLSAEKNLPSAIRSRAEESERPMSPAAVDHCLRGLLEVMDVAGNAPSREWRSIAAMLQPLLDRYNEDRICSLFTAG